ncbi:MAG: nuclear transport factor 2 family protein [Anaerolineae bacterium]|nr:nuclear transport factor 2 family protein [Anaerolineae bacterium]
MAHTDSLEVIVQFNDAFNRHDLDAVMNLMTEDCLFENTTPPPDGARYAGQPAVRAAFAAIFAASPRLWLDFEDVFVTEDHGVSRWIYRWDNGPADRGRIRGVDVLRLRDGKIAEKLSYVKG